MYKIRCKSNGRFSLTSHTPIYVLDYILRDCNGDVEKALLKVTGTKGQQFVMKKAAEYRCRVHNSCAKHYLGIPDAFEVVEYDLKEVKK